MRRCASASLSDGGDRGFSCHINKQTSNTIFALKTESFVPVFPKPIQDRLLPSDSREIVVSGLDACAAIRVNFSHFDDDSIGNVNHADYRRTVCRHWDEVLYGGTLLYYVFW